jgi:hypothetical protein
MLNWLHTFLRTSYVALLEEQVARERADNERLRAENRALMNSLLGTAGPAGGVSRATATATAAAPPQAQLAPDPSPARSCGTF